MARTPRQGHTVVQPVPTPPEEIPSRPELMARVVNPQVLLSMELIIGDEIAPPLIAAHVVKRMQDTIDSEPSREYTEDEVENVMIRFMAASRQYSRLTGDQPVEVIDLT